MARTALTGATANRTVNEVVLEGRLGSEPLRRELPSGDTVVQIRLVVPREVVVARSRDRPPGRTVDTIDVACWAKPLQRKALRLAAGQTVLVHGALRRRFWRSPGGPASRYEVEAASIEVVPAHAPD